MIEYPKIETLFDRDEHTFKVIPDRLRCPEFSLITVWQVTEKIDGMNVRVILEADGTVRYSGRTDAAQLPAVLVDYLLTAFPGVAVARAFDPQTRAVLFGEAYGPKIQSGGAYRNQVAVRLFDVAVLGERVWWLIWPNVEEIASKLSVGTVPIIDTMPLCDAIAEVRGPSLAAREDGGSRAREGIVARTEPPLFTRRGERLMWKLKTRDLPSEVPA